MDNKLLEVKESEKEKVSEEDISQNDNPFIVVFKKPFVFEGKTYDSVDLSGLEAMQASDMIAVQKIMERKGGVGTLPEASLEYACVISARVSKLPIEFFKSLPAYDAMKIKICVTNFLFPVD